MEERGTLCICVKFFVYIFTGSFGSFDAVDYKGATEPNEPARLVAGSMVKSGPAFCSLAPFLSS